MEPGQYHHLIHQNFLRCYDFLHFPTNTPMDVPDITRSTLIFFFGGWQSQFENHHKGKNNDSDESQPTDDF